MAKKLDPGGLPVFVTSDVVLETPGLAGVADIHVASGPGMRSAEAISSDFSDALKGADLIEQLTIVIDEPAEVPLLPGTATRSTSRGEPGMVAEVPGAGEGFHQMLLSVDEQGVTTWCFPEPEDMAAAATVLRSGQRCRYVIPKQVPPPTSSTGHRGLLGFVGRKILKIVAFKAIEVVGGLVGEAFVERWEAAKRSYAMRSFTPDDFAAKGGRPLTAADWTQLGAGRSLLFVHGTFSRAHSAFGSLPRETLATLHDRYDGRVFAFDHPTASRSPDHNVREFLNAKPVDTPLDLDIVCHSRGGLLSRVLSERGADPNVQVSNIVFVAAPNAGTALANPKHMGTFLDTYTSMLSLLPDNGVTDALEVILSVLKQLAVGALKSLEGLQSMNPQGQWLQQLNQRRNTALQTTYRAIAADFEPADSALRRVADRVADSIFDSRPNDLVVPTEGVYSPNGSSRFPIAEPLIIPPTESTWHSGYFSRADVGNKLLDWLPG